MVFLPVFVAGLLALGIVVGTATPGVVSWLATGAAGAAVGAAVAWRRGWPGVVPYGLTAVALSGAVLGGLAMQRTLQPRVVAVLEAHDALAADGARGTEPVRLEGRLLADAAPAGRAVLLRLAVERLWIGACGCPEPVDGQLLVTVGGDAAPGAMERWRAGRRLQVTALLRRPTSFRNLGAPDAARELARRRTALIASVKSALVVEVVAAGAWHAELAAAARARARRAIARALRGTPETSAVATAVLIGDRAGLAAPLEDRLQRAGTFHVIAISGGNIALWSMATLWLARRLTRRRPLALAAAAAALIAYAAVVGGGASVLRATGMALVGLATQWTDSRGAAINVLALTAAALMVVDPLVVFDVGFWLTSAATAGLIVGLPGGDTPRPRWQTWGRALVLTSVWAEAALLPIVATVFQQVTLAGVALSALAIPAMGVVQLGALAAVVADAAAPALLPVCGHVLALAVAIVTESARLVDVLPWLSWRVPPPHPMAVAVYVGAVATWLWMRSRGSGTSASGGGGRLAGGVAVAAAVWIAVSPATWRVERPGDLRVAMLDVGQGDATFVQFPNGRRLLVDAGGASVDGRDLGARVVGPTLRARGVRRLDVLVVTHADIDHIGGAATIVREFRPAEVWMGVAVADDAATRRLREAADGVGATWRDVRRGEHLEVGHVAVDVVHPPRPDWERQRVRNDDSVVIALRHGGVRLLLTGDIGVDVESDVAAVVTGLDGATPAAITIAKVAHHGSAGSSGAAWLAAVRPAVAVVSAGAANPFGHPAPAVLTRLAAVSADVWRTDRDGEVRVRTDGTDVELRAHGGRTRWLRAQPR